MKLLSVLDNLTKKQSDILLIVIIAAVSVGGIALSASYSALSEPEKQFLSSAEVTDDAITLVDEQGDYSQAVAELQAALASEEPYDLPEELYEQLGYLYLEQEDYQNAYESFKSAAQYYETDVPARIALSIAETAYEVGQTEDATYYATEALRVIEDLRIEDLSDSENDQIISDARLILNGIIKGDFERQNGQE